MDTTLWLIGLLWLVVVGGTFLEDSVEYERWIERMARLLGGGIAAVRRIW